MGVELNMELLRGRGRLGLAVSGGADSVALLWLCREAGLGDVAVLHLNHGLRGAESDGDAEFVASLAVELGLQCCCEKRLVEALPGESLEMAARRVRLEFFGDCVPRFELGAVVTAHQGDDVAETVLLRLARGAGAGGLSGLRAESCVNGVRLLRPLLDCSSGSLREWLTAQGRAWREDASNQEDCFLRNRVRHAVLPVLEEALGPGVATGLRRSSEILAAEDAFLDELAMARSTDVVAELLREPLALQRRIVRQRFGLGFEACERVLSAATSGEDWQVAVEGGRLLAVAQGRIGFVPTAEVRTFAVRYEEASEFCKGEAMCCTGAAERVKELEVRRWEPGDWIEPLGLEGRRKLQDVWTDLKVPRVLRHQLPVFVFEGNEVAWVPGYRIAKRLAAVPGEALLKICVEEVGA